jgi:AraC-like DNA-binding protein
MVSLERLFARWHAFRKETLRPHNLKTIIIVKYIAILILMVMTVVLVWSGILLWKKRKATGDYSRSIQAVLSWISAIFTFIFILRTWMGTTVVDAGYLEPEHTFVPILSQVSFFLYPLEVMRSVVSRARIYTLLFAPLLLFFFVGMCSGIEYTPIPTFSDIWNHIGEFNVLFRFVTLVVMQFYCFALFLVPYDWHNSSADRKFIMSYSAGFCLIGLIHLAIQLTHAYWLQIAHHIAWLSFFVSVAYYELNERLIPSAFVANNVQEEEYVSADDNLWESIVVLLETNGKWRSPELSLTSLSEQLESNRTYVGEAFKRNTGRTFVDYITRRRINYVVESLKHNPNANIYELFNYVGYRQRSTAWRNFQKITGFSPTEYVENLK